MKVVLDPLEPWSLLRPAEEAGGLGLGTYALAVPLVVVPLALMGLSAWTYLVTSAPLRRVLAVLFLRLAAFLFVVVAVLRPSLGFADKNARRGLLLVALDASESMTILDEIDSQSRWDYLQRLLKDSAPALARLKDEQQIDVEFYRFAGDTAAAVPEEPGKPDGKRTDIGGMLRHLFENRDGRRRPVGLLVLSDGADNGTRVPALTEAVRWRNLPCLVQTFGFGNPSTSDRHSDIVLTSITPLQSPVPVKSRLTVKALIDAPGFENRRVRVKLFLDDKEVKAQDETLALTRGNEVRIQTNAPAKAGEIKVTVRVEDPQRPGRPLEGELSAANNIISTFVTVSKEGMRVLLVDKPRAGEPQAISDALSRDGRIRLTNVWLRGDEAPDADTAALLDCERNAYDVIILGDVTARQLRAANPRALAGIRNLVTRGSGLLMLGGYATFGNGDWQGTEIEDLLPVDLGVRGQIENRNGVKMRPTEAGLRRFAYLTRLTDRNEDPLKAWEELKPFDGVTRLGKPRDALSSVLATTDDGSPLLVTKTVEGGEGGRVLAFGGDTTFRWIRDPATRELHRRFWQHLAVWLAKQDEAEGSVWVVPDTRRLPVRSDLGFAVGMKAKSGVPILDGTYAVEVTGPDGTKTAVPTARNGGEQRGTFTRTELPGEYTIHVSGTGKDDLGNEVSGEAAVRVIGYDEDVEMQRQAADHDFLRKLAAAGGGKFHAADELPSFLRELQNRPAERARLRLNLWPNWRATTRSPFLIFFYGLFVAMLTAEWYLRRRWGMV